MSRSVRERMLEAETNWPNLCQFLGCYLHQDWPINGGNPEEAVDTAVADWDLAGRQKVLREWREWNGLRGCQADVAASVNDGLGVEVSFAGEDEARQFMNMVYDKLIVSVRADTDERWKPEGPGADTP